MENHSEQEVIVSTEETVTQIVVEPAVEPVVEPVVEIKHVTFNPADNMEITIELYENENASTENNKPIIKNEPQKNARFGFSFNKMIKPVRNKLSKLNFF